jgi:hypothetical protein
MIELLSPCSVFYLSLSYAHAKYSYITCSHFLLLSSLNRSPIIHILCSFYNDHSQWHRKHFIKMNTLLVKTSMIRCITEFVLCCLFTIRYSLLFRLHVRIRHLNTIIVLVCLHLSNIHVLVVESKLE